MTADGSLGDIALGAHSGLVGGLERVTISQRLARAASRLLTALVFVGRVRDHHVGDGGQAREAVYRTEGDGEDPKSKLSFVYGKSVACGKTR